MAPLEAAFLHKRLLAKMRFPPSFVAGRASDMLADFPLHGAKTFPQTEDDESRPD
jgi:hypothetical protein